MTEVIEKTENKKGYKKTKLGWIPEDWDIKYLGDLCKKNISNGIFNNPNKVGKGYKLINVIDLYSEPNIKTEDLNLLDATEAEVMNFSAQKGDIFFTRSSLKLEGIAHCNIFESDEENILFECHIMKVHPKKNEIIPKYLNNYCKINISRKYFMQKAKTTTMTTIDQQTLSKLLVVFPSSLKEQEKIAEILSAWDDGIETLEKLIEQKEIFYKALMKNLLIGKIRLAEFSKNFEYKKTKFGPIPVDWQIKPLKLLFDKRIQKYSGNTEHNIFTNSATKGVILQNEYFDRSIVTEENTSNYYVVGEDDFMYNPRISQSAPAGPINRNKLGITGIASPLYTIFKAKHDTIIDFYEQYFSSNLWNNSMYIVANQGARHDRLNITSNDFMNMPLPYPPIKEQEKIANILIESYKEIQLLNSKLEKLKEQKKGLMQKLLTGQIRIKI